MSTGDRSSFLAAELDTSRAEDARMAQESSEGLKRQEYYRSLHRQLSPRWRDSVSLYRAIVDAYVEPQTHVLDIGCGHSEVLRSVFARTPHTYGVEPEAQALARNTVVRHKVVARAEALPFPDDTFDLIVSAWVVEHLEDPLRVFEEVYRVLKPGGRVIFLTPNAWNYNVWLIRLVPNALHDFLTRKLYGRQANDTFPVRYRMNTIPAMRGVLVRSGFRRAQFVLNGDPTYIAFNRPLFHLARAIERALDTRLLRAARVHIICIAQK